ncbi:dormancy-associated protein homolog 4 isoform X1 [Sesamum indicum]|uniref:Dormancy-associated protein homolog 4 isoform X1 n=1 Tax=Sesamum indicum TaxID=4182 RepID=A0A6I9STI3_SESIN|nr:dormancy-associated protein homolog 4 isoform X1 [Sesamum indicum]
MGFLHKLWDETLAGPTPETGLGKLRKHNSFSSARSSTAASPLAVVVPPHDDNLIPISRSITVIQSDAHRNLSVSVDSPSLPSSPAGSTTPNSPFSPSSPGGNFKKLTRRKLATGALHTSESESKTGYDWIVMQSALDH